MNYKTPSDKQRRRERNSSQRTITAKDNRTVLVYPGYNTSCLDINQSHDTFTNYNGEQQTCYNINNNPSYLDLVVAKHPKYDSSWYVFDRETGKTVSRYGGDTREQAIVQFCQDMEHILDQHDYSIDKLNEYLKQHQ